MNTLPWRLILRDGSRPITLKGHYGASWFLLSISALSPATTLPTTTMTSDDGDDVITIKAISTGADVAHKSWCMYAGCRWQLFRSIFSAMHSHYGDLGGGYGADATVRHLIR